jgi:hypothetical protein
LSKHNKNAKARKQRKWLKNVGDGGRLSKEGKNENDGKG